MQEDLPPLWKHQREAVKRAKDLDYFALFFSPGAGKTRTVIEIMHHKMNMNGRLLKTLVFTPPVVISNFRNEWLKFSSVPANKVIALTGSEKQRLKTFEGGGNAIFVTNYESLIMDDLFMAFRRWQPEALIFDESQRIKERTAKRTKRADILANPRDLKTKQRLPRPYSYILSGTPILNTPMDIFSQFLVLDGGERFGENFLGFRGRYFRDVNAGMPRGKYFPNWKINPGSLSEINQKIFSCGIRAETKDCIDLPEEQSITIPIELSPEQLRLYSEMKRHFITYIEDKACVATLAITKALRLNQILSGVVSLDGVAEETVLEDTPRLAALREILTDVCAQGKVLVWAVWRSNYKQIAKVCDDLGLPYVECHGGISAKEKDANVLRFQTDPATKVFIGNPASGGLGLNLVQAGYSIFYSRTFSLEHYLQARARNLRGGSLEAGHTRIVHYDLVTPGTIDELIVKALSNKQEISVELLKTKINEF